MTKRRHGKRRHGDSQWKKEQHNQYEEEEFVDDLAFAANFAIVPPLQSSPFQVKDGSQTADDCAGTGPIISPQDEDEIDIVEESSESKTEDGNDDKESGGKSDESKNDDEAKDDGSVSSVESDETNGEDDDDTNSDVDLVESMQRMQSNENDGDRTAPPRTENELDPYRTPISQLEQHLQCQLTVDAGELGLDKGTKRDTKAALHPNSLSLCLRHWVVCVCRINLG